MRDVEELHDVRELRDYDDAAAAVARLKEIYADGRGLLKAHFDKFVGGARDLPKVDACYPYLSMKVTSTPPLTRGKLAYGTVAEAGDYGTTVTNPALFESYYLEQIGLTATDERE